MDKRLGLGWIIKSINKIFSSDDILKSFYSSSICFFDLSQNWFDNKFVWGRLRYRKEENIFRAKSYRTFRRREAHIYKERQRTNKERINTQIQNKNRKKTGR